MRTPDGGQGELPRKVPSSHTTNLTGSLWVLFFEIAAAEYRGVEEFRSILLVNTFDHSPVPIASASEEVF
jgi:hypothetical protein